MLDPSPWGLSVGTQVSPVLAPPCEGWGQSWWAAGGGAFNLSGNCPSTSSRHQPLPGASGTGCPGLWGPGGSPGPSPRPGPSRAGGGVVPDSGQHHGQGSCRPCPRGGDCRSPQGSGRAILAQTCHPVRHCPGQTAQVSGTAWRRGAWARGGAVRGVRAGPAGTRRYRASLGQGLRRPPAQHLPRRGVGEAVRAGVRRPAAAGVTWTGRPKNFLVKGWGSRGVGACPRATRSDPECPRPNFCRRLIGVGAGAGLGTPEEHVWGMGASLPGVLRRVCSRQCP